MNKMVGALLCAMVAAPATALAEEGRGGFVDIYYIPSAELDVDIPGFGTISDDGDGFGIKTMIPVAEQAVLTGEYQSAGYDDSGIDISQLRLGVGIAAPSGSGAFVEYISVDTEELTGSKTDGFGIHGRLARGGNGEIGIYGQIGYLILEDDFEDIDGIELAIGASIPVSGNLGVFLDLRKSPQKGKDSDVEVELTDIRLGARFSY